MRVRKASEAKGKQPDIPFFLQDFIDMTYLMQTKVIPRYETLSSYGIDYKRRPRFSLVEKEYLKTVDLVVAGGIDYYVWESRITRNEKTQKAVYFFCMAVSDLRCFFPPNPHDLLTPNRIDMSMLEKMPNGRLVRAAENLKKLFTANESGYLVYKPEMVEQNPFVVFRDRRLSVNTIVDLPGQNNG